MIVSVVATLFGLVLCWLARRADARFRGEARLPMQWSLAGKVNWSAPRRLALAFMPAVAIVLLAVYVVLALTVPPRAGQEHLVVPILLVIGATLIAVQLLHYRLIAWTLHRAAR